jgi:hypothetical protein
MASRALDGPIPVAALQEGGSSERAVAKAVRKRSTSVSDVANALPTCRPRLRADREAGRSQDS